MPEEPVGGDAGQTDGSFEEWLENIATSEGVSEDEVLDQMMSSYWILHELTGLMEESSERGGLADSHTDHEAGSQSDIDSGDVNDRDLPEEEFERLLKIAQMFEPFSTTEGARNAAGGDPTIDRLDDEIERLQDDVERLTTRIDGLVAGSSVGSRSRDPPRTGGQAGSADFGEHLTAFSERLEELQDRMDTIESQHRDEHQRIDKNFGHVEDILKYVVGKVEELEDRVDGVTDRVSAAEVDDRNDERLRDIKRVANERDVHEAPCEKCGRMIHLALLERSECPGCGHPFDGISSEREWFGLFESNVLTLSSPPRDGTRTASPAGRSDGGSSDDEFGTSEGASSPSGDAFNGLEDLSLTSETLGGDPDGDGTSDDDFMWNSDEE